MIEPLVELPVPLPDILEEVDGEYRVTGHRIRLDHVMSAHRNGIAPHSVRPGASPMEIAFELALAAHAGTPSDFENHVTFIPI